MQKKSKYYFLSTLLKYTKSHHHDHLLHKLSILDLKDEVHTLKNLLQIEQSMYQTSNQALKLAMDAQSEEMQHTSTIEELKDFDQKLSTHEELKQFDKKAQDYENTVMKDAAKLSKTAEKSETTEFSS